MDHPPFFVQRPHQASTRRLTHSGFDTAFVLGQRSCVVDSAYSTGVGLRVFCLYSVTVNSAPAERPHTSGKYICSAWAGRTRNSPGVVAWTRKV